MFDNVPLSPRANSLKQRVAKRYLENLDNVVGDTIQFSNITGSSGYLSLIGTKLVAARAIQGVSNRTTVTNGSGVAGNTTVDISSTYAGQTSITTLGTVTTGDVSQALELSTVTNSVPRKIRDKLGEIKSVKDFGALGDGTTDDTTAINNAFASGGSIYFPAGTYKVTSSISIDAHYFHIFGAGYGNTTISSTAAGPTFLIGGGRINWSIGNINLTRASGGGTAGRDGIFINGSCDGVYLYNITIDSHYNGMNLSGTGSSTIYNCVVGANFNHGIYINDTATTIGQFQWSIIRCVNALNNGYGFYFLAANSSKSIGDIINISSFANGLGGLWIVASGGNSIPGVRIRGAFLGQDGGDELHIDTNASYPNSISDVYTELAGTTNTGIGFAQSVSNVGNGIKIVSGSGSAQLNNCTGVNNSFNGVHSSVETSITNGDFIGNGLASVAGSMNGVYSGGGSIHMVGSYCVSNNGYGFYTTHDSNIVIGNNLSSNTSGPTHTTGAFALSQISGNLPTSDSSRLTIGFLTDSAGKALINTAPASSAVNYLTLNNSATTFNPGYTAAGSDTNIGINFVCKGQGSVVNYGYNQAVSYFLDVGNAAHGIFFNIALLSSIRQITWPDAAGTVLLSSAIGSTVQAHDATLDTLSGKSFTGSGDIVLATSPTLITPALGTPSSGVATNLTGTASGLTAGHVTTNANLTGDVTSVGNATTLATVNSNVGTFGSATQVAQVTVNAKGLVTAASNVTITGVAPGGSAGGDLTGTYPNPTIKSSVSLTTPVLGVATATSINGTSIPSSKTLVVTTDKLSVLASTSSSELAGVISDETGSGSLVFATSPTLVTPILGTPTSGTLTNCSGLAIIGGTTGTLSVARGGTGQTAFPKFNAYLAADQTLTNATFTKVTLNTESFDTNNNFDTSTYDFTPTVAGYYSADFTVTFNAFAAAACIVRLYMNGGTILDELSCVSSLVGGVSISGNVLVSMNGSTDSLQLYAYQSSGVSQNILGGLRLTNFRAHLVV